ncbi:radical SAM protein, partial [Phocaeicola dorei]|uniref:radical SAM protein n=4 Tax=Phocaeicola TaxID=909656 RepID=UPI0034A26BCC
MCFIRTERSVVERHGGLSPLQQWLDWAEQLQDMGTLFILLTGGEPMLYPHFKELYTRLREMGFILTLNTNGTLIDNEMVRILQTHKPRRINVTLYGDSRETYGRLCHNPQGYTLCMEAL